jgi:cytochrome c55X
MRSLLALPLFAVFALPAASEPAPARQAELLHLLRNDCGACHGLTRQGGLGPPLTAPALAGKGDDVLAATIVHGRAGTPMPPWVALVAEDEARWLVSRLRQGAANDR